VVKGSVRRGGHGKRNVMRTILRASWVHIESKNTNGKREENAYIEKARRIGGGSHLGKVLGNGTLGRKPAYQEFQTGKNQGNCFQGKKALEKKKNTIPQKNKKPIHRKMPGTKMNPMLKQKW